MSSFVQGLKDKIAMLDDERTELEDALFRVSSKLEILEDLLAEEQGLPKTPPAGKKKRGRPKGSKSKPKVPADALYDEAVSGLGDEASTSELQKSRIKEYSPDRRMPESRGPGIRAGTKQQVMGSPPDQTGVVVSGEDENE